MYLCWGRVAVIMITHSDKPKLYLVSVSSGVPSAVAADICLRRFGPDHVELVFCDTKVEDEDNYRFLDDCARRWGKRVTVLADGRTPLELAEDEHIIPNQYLATCTEKLKFKLFKAYAEQLKEQWDVVIVLGFDWTDRNKKITRGKYAGKSRPVPSVVEYRALGFKVYYPLIAKRTFVIDPVATAKEWGFGVPRMYAMGYSHANCAGACVKQGEKDWRRTYTFFPERFMLYRDWETEQRKDPVKANYSFLRDHRGGERSTKTLAQLEAEIRQEQTSISMFDAISEISGGVCSEVECGVAFGEVEG